MFLSDIDERHRRFFGIIIHSTIFDFLKIQSRWRHGELSRFRRILTEIAFDTPAIDMSATDFNKYADKFMAEFDYTRSDWTKSGLDLTPGFAGNLQPGIGNSVFSTSISEAYRFGMEYTPNRTDIRYYFRKVSYRAGAYYKKDYYLLDGQGINSMGITLGMTLPITNRNTGLTLGIDFGQRGSMTDNLIRERYINFNVGISIFDTWFVKYHYD